MANVRPRAEQVVEGHIMKSPDVAVPIKCIQPVSSEG